MATTLTVVPKDEQRSVIWFLTLENVSGMRMCTVYGMQNVITKSTVNQWVQKKPSIVPAINVKLGNCACVV